MSVSLSTGVRAALSSLQTTRTQAQGTQLRLATGKRVNTALDNPVNFFTSQSLQSRAGSLNELLDGIGNAVKTIEAADKGLKAVTSLIQQAQSTLRQALNDALSSRPNAAAAAAYATGAEVTATGGKTLKQIAEDKLLEGAVTAATSTVPGNLGVGAGSTVEITAGGTATAPIRSFRFTTSATTTVRDFVNQINTSGIATAAVDETGTLRITGTGSDVLRVRVGTATAGDTTSNAVLGLTAATFWTAGLSATSTSTVRSGLINQFNDLRTQIGQLAKDAGYNGNNLLDGNQLTVTFNERTGSNRSTLTIQGSRISATDLGILTASGTTGAGLINFQNDSELNTALDTLTNTLSSVRTIASGLGSNLSIVQTRQDFTRNLVDTLQSGADDLVLADSNEEGASLLALNTRQQLSQTALSLASQSDQAVLRLFG
jgi:flagellin